MKPSKKPPAAKNKTRRRTGRRWFFFVLLVLSLAAVIFGAIWVLPTFVEQRLLPDLADRLGIPSLRAQVRHIGPSHVDLAHVTIGSGADQTVAIDSLRMDYTPNGLRRGEIHRLHAAGVTIRCRMADGRLVLPGIDLPAGGSLTPPDAAPATLSPWPAEHVRIEHGTLFFEHAGATEKINFGLLIRPSQARPEHLSIDARLHWRQQTMQLAAAVDLKAQSVEIDFTAPNVKPQYWPAAVLPAIFETVRGKLSSTGHVRFQWAPFRITEARTEMDIGSLQWATGPIYWRPSLDLATQTRPIIVELSSDGEDLWKIQVPQLPFHSPRWPIHGSTSAVATYDAGGLQVQARLEAKLSADHALWPSTPVQPIEDIKMTADLKGNIDPQGQWHLTAATPPGKSTAWKLDTRFGLMTGALPKIKLTGSGQGSAASFDARIEAADLSLTRDPDAARLASIVAHARFKRSLKRLWHSPQPLKITAKRLSMQAGDTLWNIPELHATGHWRQLKKGQPQIQIRTTAETIGWDDPAKDIQARLRADVPLQWPPPQKKGPEGSIEAESIRWQQKELGGFKLSLKQIPKGVDFNGRWQIQPLPEAQLLIDGHWHQAFERRPMAASLHCALPPYRLPAQLDLGDFVPDMSGIQLDGKVHLDGHVDWTANQSNARLTFGWQEGRVHMPEKKWTLEGITTELAFPDLPTFRSASGQQIRFDRLSLGQIAFKQGVIDFTLESPDRILVEKSAFKWCNGHVYGQSARLSGNNPRHEFTFYGDRLHLASLLDQFGTLEAHGEGTVNGRIPLTIEGKQIRVSDGFLFSTPGDGGTIRVTGTEIITAGVPAGTAEHAQLMLARAALEDYRYDWVKLFIHSQDESLHVKMKMNGRPEKPLPFTYDQKVGHFVRVQTGASGSRFQGIHLDVNFQLPLNQLIRYGDAMQPLFE